MIAKVIFAKSGGFGARLAYGASGKFAPTHSGFEIGAFCNGLAAFCRGVWSQFRQSLVFPALPSQKRGFEVENVEVVTVSVKGTR